MPNLLIRDMPEELYEKLKERARHEHRSMSAEVISLLTDALSREQHREAMRSIIERTAQKQPLGEDSIRLLREARER